MTVLSNAINRLSGFVVFACGIVLGASVLTMPFPSTSASAAETLEPVVTGLPWPSATRLITYRNELWFVNSVKGRNHNSADLYSLDTKTRKLRYRHHLFSQDAGQPVKQGGLLHWPMEDDRFSLGWGSVASTDGETWHYRQIQGDLIFHTHALAKQHDTLVAANSGWDAILNTSSDGGKTWREFYRYPTPELQVSRITSVVVLQNTLFARFRIKGRPDLVYVKEGLLHTVPGWPASRRLTSLAASSDVVVAGLQSTKGNWELWSTNGKSSTRITTPFDGTPIADVHFQDRLLWVLTRGPSGAGRIWSMTPDRKFEHVADVTNGFPRDLLVFDACMFVGGDGPDGAGKLWMSERCRELSQIDETAPKIQDVLAQPPARYWAEAAREVRNLLSRPDRYRAGANNLRDVVYKYAMQRPPHGFFGDLITETFPSDQISLIGGRVKISSETYARWVILWGMGLAREASIPLRILRQPWSAPPNRAEKYFDNLPAALWAIRNANQNDRDTLSTLVERLSRTDDPQWIRHQMGAVLASLTNQAFTTDAAIWQTRVSPN